LDQQIYLRTHIADSVMESQIYFQTSGEGP